MNNDEFKKWQNKFYKSKQWRLLRTIVENESLGKCNRCGKLILKKGEGEVDHIKEINIYNCNDNNVTLNVNNLQLLCHKCHNVKTSIDKISNKNSLQNGLKFDYDKRDSW